MAVMCSSFHRTTMTGVIVDLSVISSSRGGSNNNVASAVVTIKSIYNHAVLCCDTGDSIAEGAEGVTSALISASL